MHNCSHSTFALLFFLKFHLIRFQLAHFFLLALDLWPVDENFWWQNRFASSNLFKERFLHIHLLFHFQHRSLISMQLPALKMKFKEGFSICNTHLNYPIFFSIFLIFFTLSGWLYDSCQTYSHPFALNNHLKVLECYLAMVHC